MYKAHPIYSDLVEECWRYPDYYPSFPCTQQIQDGLHLASHKPPLTFWMSPYSPMSFRFFLKSLYFPVIFLDFPIIFHHDPTFFHDVPSSSHVFSDMFPMIFPWFPDDFRSSPDLPMTFPWFPATALTQTPPGFSPKKLQLRRQAGHFGARLGIIQEDALLFVQISYVITLMIVYIYILASCIQTYLVDIIVGVWMIWVWMVIYQLDDNPM